MNSRRHLSLSDLGENLYTDYNDQYQDFCTLAHFLCIIPQTSVPYERGSRVQKRALELIRSSETWKEK